jgi:hypothetical protein
MELAQDMQAEFEEMEKDFGWQPRL